MTSYSFSFLNVVIVLVTMKICLRITARQKETNVLVLVNLIRSTTDN